MTIYRVINSRFFCRTSLQGTWRGPAPRETAWRLDVSVFFCFAFAFTPLSGLRRRRRCRVAINFITRYKHAGSTFFLVGWGGFPKI